MIRQLKIAVSVTKRESKSVEKYLQEIGKIPELTSEQEVSLTQKMKAGDEKAFKVLVNSNLRFVVSVAKQYQNQGLTLLDLINIGNEGLIKAVRRFDETRGFKLISYAVWWIRQSILAEIAESGRIVRLPLNKLSLQNKVIAVMQSFEQEFERQPDAKEIADLLNTEVYYVEQCMLSMNKRHVSLDAPISEEGDATMGDFFVSDTPSPDAQLIKTDLKDAIMRALNKLPPLRRDIVILFFGIGQDQPLSLESIGERVNLTRERVRQIKERGVKQLQKSSLSKHLKAYLG